MADAQASGEPAGGRGGRDFWDKMQAIAGITSGVLVALIGGLFTYVYNERERDAQEAQNRRQLAIQEVQTLQTLFPHLQSSDPREKAFAIIAISTLGNPELAARVAETYRDEGSVEALEKLAVSSDPVAAKAARRSLSDILATMRAAVVRVGFEGGGRTSGFVASNGIIATVGSGVKAGDRVTLTYRGGDEEQATVVHGSDGFDVVLVKSSRRDRATLPIKPGGDVSPGTEVAVLGYGVTDWVGSTGTITLPRTRDGRRELTATITTQAGLAGAPVVTREGEVVALHLGKDGQSAFLLPASAVARAIRSLDK